MHQFSQSNQRGNVLFMILIAVGLFAALSYAVTSSTQGTAKSASSESASAQASSILNFMAQISNFMMKARVIDGVADDEFTFAVSSNFADAQNYQFANNTYNCWNYNARCTRPACRVFQPFNPNGIPAQRFEMYADAKTTNAWYPKHGHLSFDQLVIKGLGTNAPEVVATLHALNPDLCNKINEMQGITTNYNDTSAASDSLPSLGETYATSRVGQYGVCGGGSTTLNTSNTVGDENPAYSGKNFFCIPYRNPGFAAEGSQLALIYVLMER